MAMPQIQGCRQAESSHAFMPHRNNQPVRRGNVGQQGKMNAVRLTTTSKVTGAAPVATKPREASSAPAAAMTTVDETLDSRRCTSGGDDERRPR
jgi:hypothetical protein